MTSLLSPRLTLIRLLPHGNSRWRCRDWHLCVTTCLQTADKWLNIAVGTNSNECGAKSRTNTTTNFIANLWPARFMCNTLTVASHHANEAHKSLNPIQPSGLCRKGKTHIVPANLSASLLASVSKYQPLITDFVLEPTSRDYSSIILKKNSLARFKKLELCAFCCQMKMFNC